MNKDLINIVLKTLDIDDIGADEITKFIDEHKEESQDFIDKLQELDKFIKETSNIGYEFNNQKSKDLFNNCYAAIRKNINYLYTGYFFSTIARDDDFSSKYSRINIKIKIRDYEFPLEEHIIKDGLKELYYFDQIYKDFSKDYKNYPDFFAHLTLKSVIRNVVMIMRETLNYKLGEDNKEITELFIKYIFKGNESEYKHFYQVLRFMRNVLSHNADNEIILNEDDYKDQKKTLGKKGITIVNFKFNKGNLFPEDVDIKIDFNSLKPGDRYEDIISTKQTVLFILLCHNFILYLNNLRLKPFLLRSDVYFINSLLDDISKT